MTNAQTEARAIAENAYDNLALGYDLSGMDRKDVVDTFAAFFATALAAKDAELAAQIEVRDIYRRDFHAAISRAERADAQLAEARKALDGLLKPFEGDDCRYDHHGYCQAHFLQEGDECCVKIARRVREQGGE